MIVGNGLVATAFKSTNQNFERHIIFASGVSNSRETRQESFDRERNLIKSVYDKDKIFIYFSTTSIFDQSLQETPYVSFKKSIEDYIRSVYNNYIIVRLPILVGNTNNPNTLFNFLKNKIVSNESFYLFKNAYRYLLDIDDLIAILNPEIKKSKIKSELNIVPHHPIYIKDLINLIENKLNRKANYIEIDKGSKTRVNSNTNFHFPDNYYEQIVNKYL